MTPYLQEVIEWRLYPMHGFFCACSFVVGEFIFSIHIWSIAKGIVQYTSVSSQSCGRGLRFVADIHQCIRRRWAFHWKKWTPYLEKVRTHD